MASRGVPAWVAIYNERNDVQGDVATDRVRISIDDADDNPIEELGKLTFSSFSITPLVDFIRSDERDPEKIPHTSFIFCIGRKEMACRDDRL